MRDNKLILLVGAVSLIMFVGLLLPAVFTNLSEDGIETEKDLGEYSLGVGDNRTIGDATIYITDITNNDVSGYLNSTEGDRLNFTVDQGDTVYYQYNISEDKGYTLDIEFKDFSKTEDYADFEVVEYYMNRGMIGMYEIYPLIMVLSVLVPLLFLLVRVVR